MFNWLKRKSAGKTSHFRYRTAAGAGGRVQVSSAIDREYAAFREGCYQELWGESDEVSCNDLLSDPYIDVHQFPPRGDRSWWVIATSGMSDAPMVFRDSQSSGSKRAELVVYTQQPRKSSINLLNVISHTVLGEESGIEHGSVLGMPRSFNDQTLDHYLFFACSVDPDASLPRRFAECGREFALLQVALITEAEVDYRFEHGIEAMLASLKANQNPLIFDVSRGG